MTAIALAAFPVKEIDRVLKRRGGEIFSPSERRRASGRRYPHETLAARLAAKSALASVWSEMGVPAGDFGEIEIANDRLGRPFFKFLNARMRTLVRLNARAIHVSLSHTRGWGIAAVAVRLP